MSCRHQSTKLGTVLPNPLGERFLRNATFCKGKDLRNDLRVAGRELIGIQAEERHHRQESDALVSIAIGMVSHEAERASSGERRKIGTLTVMPFLPRLGESGFEEVLVSNAG